MLQIAFTSANCPIFYNLNPKEAFKNKNPFMQMSQHFALLGPHAMVGKSWMLETLLSTVTKTMQKPYESYIQQRTNIGLYEKYVSKKVWY